MMAKLIFFGTSSICLPFLEELIQHFDIPLMVTQPDARGGRKRQLIEPPVKTFAQEHHIDVIQPLTLKDDAIADQIRALEPDLGIAISYGKLIPKRIFSIPTFRTVNVHFSKLPFYRGAAPVQRALEQGDTQTAIAIFEIVKKLDAGDLWAEKTIDILPHETTQDLWERMSLEGAPFLCETVNGILDSRLKKTPQDHQNASYAPCVTKEEGVVDWQLTATQLYNKFRAFTPWPGLSSVICNKSIKLIEIKVSPLSHRKQPGDVLGMDKSSLKVCCGNGSVLEVIQLQPQGKKPMTPYCYCQGNQLPECLV